MDGQTDGRTKGWTTGNRDRRTDQMSILVSCTLFFGGSYQNSLVSELDDSSNVLIHGLTNELTNERTDVRLDGRTDSIAYNMFVDNTSPVTTN